MMLVENDPPSDNKTSNPSMDIGAVSQAEYADSSLAETIPVGKYEAVLKDVMKEFDMPENILLLRYEGEQHLPYISNLITKDLSEPYSVYTYRYFVATWPQYSLRLMDKDECIGCIVAKLEYHKSAYRGYIAMLAVDKRFRGRKYGTALVVAIIRLMQLSMCDEVVLETEASNSGALRLYSQLGFVKHKRLNGYYLNGVDAFRLKLWLR
ncbi:hypothetical protein SARC_02396 [Sphaeroforma arctica JP610]|uniref:N-acetyltransferase domain-containing protein n=1 Tax=Sphaeroforma arctica JP610 TaxID=667725 RepID=A0A0L0G982_9EUKA|nr:hypothetical protein SARC_02396 [Sphaeroforma arctica JP610]KNC85446.1 hypothetical protein SARC_02396 [Sphaeroforma arctica JP610]|eukprot:XP_014159348.1 hypothetical protein SARC_02396 [Sphaeroforma arctica JP610]